MLKFIKKQEQQICKEYFSKEEPGIILLAKKWNCGQVTISNIIERNGYKLRTKNEKKKIFSKEQELQICKEYFSKKKPSTLVLAKKWNCDPTTIAHSVKRNRYFLRPCDILRRFTKEQERQICDEYFSKEKPSVLVLAKRWSCHHTIIRCVLIRNRYNLRTRSEAHGTPEAIQQSLKNGYGTKCYYNNEFFPSLQERDCYIYLNQLGYLVIHNWLGRFDFLVNGKIVVEFHSYDLKSLTNKQYYWKRRKLLDEYGYKDLKLVVIKDLKEIENKLISKEK